MDNPPLTLRLTRQLAALCHREIAEPPPNLLYDYFTEADYDRAVEQLLAGRPTGPMWLFAYGSLIWKPEFKVQEMQRAFARGWKRGFSMRIQSFRGTPEQPGLMMCLDTGGCCDGMILRLADGAEREQLRKLLYRELGSEEALEAVRWIDVDTPSGACRALAFYACPDRLDYYTPNIPFPEIAHTLARACGHWGSGAEYLLTTVSHLKDIGIHDADLWHLQELVAAEIEALYGASVASQSPNPTA